VSYLDELVRRLRHLLGASLVGVYLTGSAAFDATVPGRSDVDVIGVVEPWCPPGRVGAVASACSHRMLPCPARKLELVLYPIEAVRSDPPPLDWILNLNTGADGETASFDPSSEPGHWFVLDVAIARDRARALLGPPPHEVFAPLGRGRLLGAVRDSIAWHREHEPTSSAGVLNAGRGWAWAATGDWRSKQSAAAWVLERTSHAAVVRRALAIHVGELRASLRPAAVAPFLAEVERELGRTGG
jgi:hypothetical protein